MSYDIPSAEEFLKMANKSNVGTPITNDEIGISNTPPQKILEKNATFDDLLNASTEKDLERFIQKARKELLKKKYDQYVPLILDALDSLASGRKDSIILMGLDPNRNLGVDVLNTVSDPQLGAGLLLYESQITGERFMKQTTEVPNGEEWQYESGGTEGLGDNEES